MLAWISGIRVDHGKERPYMSFSSNVVKNQGESRLMRSCGTSLRSKGWVYVEGETVRVEWWKVNADRKNCVWALGHEDLKQSNRSRSGRG